MNLMFSLKTKFVFIFTVFTFIILSIVLIYFYISSRDNLYNQASKDTIQFTLTFKNAIEKRIQNSIQELNGLLSRINSLNFKDDSDNKQQEILQEYLRNFINGYPYSYFSIAIINNQSKIKTLVKPMQGLDGSITPTISKQPLNSYDKELISKITQTDSQQLYLSTPQKSLPGKPFFVIQPLLESEMYFLQASINFDYLMDFALKDLNIPMSFKSYVIDSGGSTLYASDVLHLNQNIKSILSINSINIVDDQQDIYENYVQYIKEVQYLNVFVLIQKNLEFQLNNLLGQIQNAIIFALLIFLFTIITVSILLLRMTESLNEVTRVSSLVAKGDFSAKMNIKRQDELGELINAFNKMVDNLDKSYKKQNQINLELEKKIHELQQTKAELLRKERLAVIGETLSKISHEIQNKIGGVSVWVQNLETLHLNDESSVLYIDEIKQALDSFAEMLNNFKKFYREPHINRELVNLEDLIEIVIHKYSSETEAKKIGVKKLFEEPITKNYGDSQLLEEVIENIFLNAIYFSPVGGSIEIEYFQKNNLHYVLISDDGPGIPQNDLERVFQPFYTTKNSGGGLGLAISYNIVKAHDGDIIIDNRRHKGTTFKIQLPV